MFVWLQFRYKERDMQHVNGVIESEPHFANSIHGQTNIDMQIFAHCTIDFIIKNLSELDERGIVDILFLMEKV